MEKDVLQAQQSSWQSGCDAWGEGGLQLQGGAAAGSEGTHSSSQGQQSRVMTVTHGCDTLTRLSQSRHMIA